MSFNYFLVVFFDSQNVLTYPICTLFILTKFKQVTDFSSLFSIPELKLKLIDTIERIDCLFLSGYTPPVINKLKCL